MSEVEFSPYREFPSKRYKETLAFLVKNLAPNSQLLDLGVANPFTPFLVESGFDVHNTGGEDLDLNWEAVKNSSREVLTAFEILEHLVNPFMLLKESSATKLVATVPLQLWFSKPYRNLKDQRDWHYHEFVDWQFDMLLEKAGWEIKDKKKWTNPSRKLGLRPLLRNFTPRYYAVYAERK